MKTNKSDISIKPSGSSITRKNHLFSNHGSLSSSIIGGGYGPYNNFISNRMNSRSNSK